VNSLIVHSVLITHLDKTKGSHGKAGIRRNENHT
jgi:hypothetical protein